MFRLWYTSGDSLSPPSILPRVFFSNLVAAIFFLKLSPLTERNGSKGGEEMRERRTGEMSIQK